MNPTQLSEKAMVRALEVLLVEDSENDALLLQLELERAGFAPVCQRVETPEAMCEALQKRPCDLIIADYVLPSFNALAALSLVKKLGLDIPFIVVSGHVSEATAVSAMKAGARDYVMKDNLVRLGPAVTRELREAEVRREQRRSEEKLKIESTLRRAIENSVPSGIAAIDLDGRQTYVNPAFCEMVGWSEAELVGARPPFVYWPPDQVDTIADLLARVVEGHASPAGLELRYRRRSGEYVDVLLQVTPLKDTFGNVSGWVSAVSDISERKRAEIRLAAEHAITRILANASSLDEAAPGMVQVLLDALEVDLGTLWTVDEKRNQLQPLISTLRRSSPALQKFYEMNRRLSFDPGVEIPGKAWQERRAVWCAELTTEAAFPRHGPARKAGLTSAVAFPIHSAGTLFGVIEFFSVRRLEPDQIFLNMMAAIGSETGQFSHRRMAEDALRRAHDDLEIRVQKRTADLKLANLKLQASISERRRLEHELLEITEKERKRIGLDLHDDLGQKLSGIALMTKSLEIKLSKQKHDATQDARSIYELVQEAMSHASGLARDLTSLDINDHDLCAALNSLAHRARDLFGVTCDVESRDGAPPLEASTVAQIYKIAQEAVTNAIKHGKASNVLIRLALQEGMLLLTVENDGRPFPDLNSQSTGMGLRIMNYRASLVGASLQVRGIGETGTLVTCAIPLESSAARAASKP